MINLDWDEKDLARHPSKKGSEKYTFVFTEINHLNQETHSLKMTPHETVALVLNLSTPHASFNVLL
jgi:hypothetical protein